MARRAATWVTSWVSTTRRPSWPSLLKVSGLTRIRSVASSLPSLTSAVATAAIWEKSCVLSISDASSAALSGTITTTRLPHWSPHTAVTRGIAAEASEATLRSTAESAWPRASTPGIRTATTGPRSHSARGVRPPTASKSSSAPSSQRPSWRTKVRWCSSTVGLSSKPASP